jgi:hypothetical protein
MSVDVNRLLIGIEQAVKNVNKDVINPEIDVLKIDQLNPVMKMVAHTRADYIKAIFNIAEQSDGLVSPEETLELRQKREAYEELTSAFQALTTAIERGYLDVESL